MKTIIITVFLMISFLFITVLADSSAQVSQQWSSFYNGPANNGDIPKAMVVDNPGNIYVTGFSPSSTTAKDFATIKYNSAGVQQWAARYNSGGAQDDEARGIALDASGNVYVTGSVSTGVQTTVKYNSSGIQQWAKEVGVPGATSAAAGKIKSPIAVDASGNIYVGGSRKMHHAENESMLLIKYNSNGDSLWTRRYKGTQFLQGLGSAISCVKVDGNFIYATGKTFDMNPNITFVTTLKYDLEGVAQWIRQDTLIFGSDEVNGIETDASGNIIVTCNYGYNIVTFKYNSAGARLWKKSYTGISGDFYDAVTGIAIDPANNIYLTGSSVRSTGQEDFLTMKYDASGNQIWDRFYNGTGNDGDYAKGIAVDAGGNVYVTGRVFDTPFDVNFMTIKYDTDGVQKWKVSYDGGNNHNDDEAVGVCLDPSGDVIVTGIANRSGTVDDYATIKYSQSVGITQISTSTPESFSLSQNYPNPFNPKTVISYRVAVSSAVSLKVYDMLGNVISVLINEYQKTGEYEVDFDAGDIPSSIYFYKLTANEFSETKKMNLIK